MFFRFLLPLIFGTLAAAQTLSLISGRVSDPKGLPVVGAKVTLEQADGGFQRGTHTNEAGQYLFPPAPAGTYRIRVEATGFAAVEEGNLKADVATALVQDFQLSLGPVTTIVEVKAAAAMLQTADASIGATISGDIIRRLPNFSRDASALFSYQPGVQPSGETNGARGDQNSVSIDGGDVSDVNAGFWVPPLPAESVDEFRALVANPSGTLGTGSGAQFHLQTKRGSNEFHGSIYWYLQNEALNANSWDRNRLGSGKDAYRKNLYGASAGGPLWKRRTYFYSHYEGSRLQTPVSLTRLVPSDTLRQGVLRFRDAGGEVHAIEPREYDPRGLGADPAILEVLRKYPAGNDPTQGDGLNTAGLTFSVPRLTKDEFGLLRLDHDLNDKWRLEASGRLEEWEVHNPTPQMDLVARRALQQNTRTPRYVTVAATGAPTPHLTTRLQFSWVQHHITVVPGSDARIAPLDIASDLGANLLAELIVGVNPLRLRRSTNYFQPSGQLHWQKGAHQVQGGFSLRDLRRFDIYAYRPYAAIGAAQMVPVPARQRPAFLRPFDVRKYNVLYSTLLGIVDSVSETRVRNARLEPLPSGSRDITHPSARIWEYFLQDVWRVRPSLTITYGLTYGWQTPPTERDGLQLVPVYLDGGAPIDPRGFLEKKQMTAKAGQVYNPDIAFQPVRNLGRETTYDVDRADLAPRVSAAWSPSFEHGLLGRIFGRGRGVLRGGYGLRFDRTNLTTSFDLPLEGIGFTEALRLSPRNSQGEPFRMGIDGPTPLPEMAPGTAPIVPAKDGSQYMTSSLDPHLPTPRNHEVSLSFQRELPGSVVVEAAYVGRMARRLYSTINLNNFPYKFRDPVSGQAFAEAFDGLAAELRAGLAPDAVTRQPWFENMLPGVGTQGVAAEQAGALITGDLGSLGLYLNGQVAGPLMNQQAQMIVFRTSEGRSNYHGAILSVNKRFSHGLQLSASYTYSHSLDQVGFGQYDYTLAPNSFDLDAGYGSSEFDHRHVMSGLWLYELPLGKGRRYVKRGGWTDKLAGGWYLSGLLRGFSGDPMLVYFSPQAFGGGEGAYAAGAVPLSKPSFDNAVHGTPGSGGIGTGADPAAGGTGLNRFADPEAMFKNFRPIRLAADGRGGRGDLRGYVTWNLDLGVGKMTRLSEKVRFGLSFEFTNVLNQVVFGAPSLDLNSPETFGVLGWQSNTPRQIQVGARLEW